MKDMDGLNPGLNSLGQTLRRPPGAKPREVLSGV